MPAPKKKTSAAKSPRKAPTTKSAPAAKAPAKKKPAAEALVEAKPLAAGSPAPAFSFLGTDGSRGSTADFAGKPYVVYFYPRDDTPGCTIEACGFRDAWAAYRKAGVPVVGVSTDDDKSHAKFITKYSLPFPLAADTDQAIVKAWGVWGKKVFMGRTFNGTHRVTFLVGADGRIAKVWPKVSPEGHAAEVLAAASAAR